MVFHYALLQIRIRITFVSLPYIHAGTLKCEHDVSRILQKIRIIFKAHVKSHFKDFTNDKKTQRSKRSMGFFSMHTVSGEVEVCKVQANIFFPGARIFFHHSNFKHDIAISIIKNVFL